MIGKKPSVNGVLRALGDGKKIIMIIYINTVRIKFIVHVLSVAKTAKKKQVWSGGKNWSIADEKRIEEMKDQILDNE